MGISPHKTPLAVRSTDVSEEKAIGRELGEAMVWALILAVLIMLFVARAFTVEGPSMTPTLQTGERLLIDKVTYRLYEPRRGDVVVFRYPQNTRQYYIKRIIGLPGDDVHIVKGSVYINGYAMEEEYTAGSTFGTFGPYTVPEGHYFMLGDNRNNSEDSRSEKIGAIPRELIVGRAFIRYWPLPRSGFIHSERVADPLLE